MDLLNQYKQVVRSKIDKLNKLNLSPTNSIYTVKSNLQLQQKQLKRRNHSLLTIFNELNSKEKSHQLGVTKQHFGGSQLMQDPRRTIVIDGGRRGQRVSNTINSINQYSEHLKITLLKQYHYNRQECSRNNSLNQMFRPKQQQKKSQSYQRPEKKTINEGKSMGKSKSGLHKSTYQTLNILHKAIIDGTFRKKKKSQFILEATQLPIIQRRKNRPEETFTDFYKDLNKNTQDEQINNISQYPKYSIKQRQHQYSNKIQQARKTYLKFRKQNKNKQKYKVEETQIDAWNIQEDMNVE